jgi:hypothetical protein
MRLTQKGLRVGKNKKAGAESWNLAPKYFKKTFII